MAKFFRIPTDEGDMFHTAFINPDNIVFIGYFKPNPQMTEPLALVNLASGMKLAIPVKVVAEWIEQLEAPTTSVPDAFLDAWAKEDADNDDDDTVKA